MVQLGQEIIDWSKLHRSPYYFMRKSWGFGTSLPTVWMVGGYFYVTDIITAYRGIWQNQQTVKNAPAIWHPVALHEDSIASMVLIFGDTLDGDTGEFV